VNSFLHKQVEDYFNSSVLLFQDDSRFGSQLRANAIRFLPHELKIAMQDIIIGELQSLGSCKTSKQMQFNCKLLYTLSLTMTSDSQDSFQNELRILETVLNTFQTDDCLDFQIRFPIHEKYYACLYFILEALSRSANVLNYSMSHKVNFFTLMFGGLSSGFTIIQVMCKQIMKNFANNYGITECTKLQS